jgi:hypothetical protein
MKNNKFTVRGYKGVTHLEFVKEDISKLVEILGEDRLIAAVNTAEISHVWNSAFEDGLVSSAEAAGHVKKDIPTGENDKDGKPMTKKETNSNFLKRTAFELTDKEAQALADSIPFPAPYKARGEKVDKEVVERLALATGIYASEEKTAMWQKKLAVNELPAIKFSDYATDDEAIAAIAESIRAYRMAI